MIFFKQVIKYESVIHEFDPYFNYRVTQVWISFCFFMSNLLNCCDVQFVFGSFLLDYV